jgi:hypothetical protein
MRRSIISDLHRCLVVLSFLLVILLHPNRALSISVDLSPRINAQFSGSKTHLEFGPEFKFDHLRFRLLGKFPLSDGDGGEVVQFDRYLPFWLLTASLDYEIDFTGLSGPSRFLRFGLKGGWNRKEFTYTPDLRNLPLKSKKETDSYFTMFRARYIYAGGTTGESRWQVSPQIRVKYEKTYGAGAKLGVVVPGFDDYPSAVLDVTTGPPFYSKSLHVLCAVFLYPGTDLSVAYAPAVSFSTTGKKNSDDVTGGPARLQVESWLFCFPAVRGIPNVRIGISPFLSIRTSGRDSLEKTEYGGLLQLRIGTEAYEY